MSEDDNEFEAVAQMLDRVSQTTQHVGAETVASHSDDEQVVQPFVENKFERNTGVRAAKNRRKWTL